MFALEHFEQDAYFKWGNSDTSNLLRSARETLLRYSSIGGLCRGISKRVCDGSNVTHDAVESIEFCIRNVLILETVLEMLNVALQLCWNSTLLHVRSEPFGKLLRGDPSVHILIQMVKFLPPNLFL